MNPKAISALLDIHRHRVAILDTNLLVLAITAAVDPVLISRFERTNQFSSGDAILLGWLLGQFKGFATTSYVLAEASNLGNKLTGRTRSTWYQQLARFAASTHESHIDCNSVGLAPETVWFGITDSALKLLSVDHLIITAEWPLAGYLSSLEMPVLNFNNFRPLWMLVDEI